MEILNNKKWTLHDWKESRPIALRALMEEDTEGIVSVKCPKCNFPPEVLMTLDGGRTIIRCKCGYVNYLEINF